MDEFIGELLIVIGVGLTAAAIFLIFGLLWLLLYLGVITFVFGIAAANS